MCSVEIVREDYQWLPTFTYEWNQEIFFCKNHRREGREWQALLRWNQQVWEWLPPSNFKAVGEPRSFTSSSSQVCQNFWEVNPHKSLTCPCLFTKLFRAWLAVNTGQAKSAEKQAGRCDLRHVLITNPAGSFCHSIILPNLLSGQELV
jgi:hypothetical protein